MKPRKIRYKECMCTVRQR